MRLILISALLITFTALQGCNSPVNSLDNALTMNFTSNENLRFIGHESVQHEIVDRYGNEKYLVLDFRYTNMPVDEQIIQRNIDEICMSVFANEQLIQNLTDAGYDMVSISLDLYSQYDCL
ncbi:hypothetical protein OLMES_0384 [Oleiphilus messinensis]|uniref:Lipoprotein n=1 Tax=Oleiphilus messinensis TaxID=141451 RepID=A0A1Y0I1W6_9GAMM|nr:hypothetical protein [Oleiphilus messinensis]ARU54488.1 hypothetical protein OLMES_0384 [Oleiphilus messinensis]